MSLLIHSKRLLLRPVETQDILGIYAYRSDTETNKYRGLIPGSIDELKNLVSRYPEQFNVPGSWFQFCILLKPSNELIGDIGVHFLGEENRQCELGCTLAKAFHGKGYATEAMRQMVHFLFDDLGKHRITASIDPRNKPSIQLFNRLNFRKEAHFVKSIRLGDEWVDDLIYARLQSEHDHAKKDNSFI